jgi:hypothetical protein
MGIIFFWGTLFLNSCLHGLQKLNYYNHTFKNYLQVFELELKFVVVWKIEFKYLKIGEMFLQIFGFFSKHLNIDVVNIHIYMVNWVRFITEIKPLKNGGYFWGTFSNPNDMTKIVFES